MVFGESRLKDAYRSVVWGPWRQALEAAPDLTELAANRAMGRMAHRVMKRKREDLRSRMQSGLGAHPDLDRFVIEAFETHFLNQYVAMTFAKVNEQNHGRYLRFLGQSHLDRALERGRGVVVAHPHSAIPQLPLHVLGLLGYAMHQVGGGKTKVALSPAGERAAALRADLESRIRATLHDGTKFVRPLLRALDQNAVVFTACDGTGGGEELGRREVRTVLGKPMRLPVFAEWLAERSGATLLTLHTRRNRGPGPPFLAEIGAPITGEDPTGQIAERLSQQIRKSPGDWHFWDAFHDGPGGLLTP